MAASLPECSNYSRLACLIMEEGTDRIRRAVLANFPEPALGFRHNIAQSRPKMEKLLHKNIINSLQFETLFPASGASARISQVDMTLWTVLARNLCRKSGRIQWKKYPAPNQVKWQHDVLRLRDARNFLFHLSMPELKRDIFEEKWAEVTSALRRLGSEEEILESYAQRDLDPLETSKSTLKVREQVLVELQCVIKSEQYTVHLLKLVIVLAIVFALVVLCSTNIPMIILLKQPGPCEDSVATVYTGYGKGLYRYMPYNGWHPKHSKNITYLPANVSSVIIGQTYLYGTCTTSTECCQELRYFQNLCRKQAKIPDLPFNYLLGGDGVIYEAVPDRAIAYLLGKQHSSMNNRSISIGLIGRGYDLKPYGWIIDRMYLFIDHLVSQQRVAVDYTLYAECQLEELDMLSPGEELLHIIQNWTHYNKSIKCTKKPKMMDINYHPRKQLILPSQFGN